MKQGNMIFSQQRDLFMGVTLGENVAVVALKASQTTLILIASLFCANL